MSDGVRLKAVIRGTVTAALAIWICDNAMVCLGVWLEVRL